MPLPKSSRLRTRPLGLLLALLLAAAAGVAMPAGAATSEAETSPSTTRLAQMPPGGSVVQARVGPDDTTVLYLTSGLTATGHVDAWTVELQHEATPVLLSRDVDGTPINVASARFSPDGSTVLFAGSRSEPGTVYSALYRAPVDGSAPPTRLSEFSSAPQGVRSWQWTPDGTTLVYHHGWERLWSVPADGTVEHAAEIATTATQLMAVSDTAVLYRAWSDGPDLVWPVLYRVPLWGPESARVLLNHGTPSLWVPRVSPDRSTVVFEEDGDHGATHPYTRDLWSVPADGSCDDIVQLNPSLGPWESVDDWTISSDSERVLYWTRTGQDDPRPLYSVPIRGPAASSVQLNGSLGGDSATETATTTPDGTRTVFVARDDRLGDPQRVVSVPTAGPATAAVQLSAVPQEGDEIFGLRVNATGARAVYTVRRPGQGNAALFSAPVDGSSPAILLAGTHRTPWSISPDGAEVLHAVGGDLYRVPVTGPSSSSQRVNDPLPVSGYVHSWDVTSDAAVVVYIADQDVAGRFELYAAGPLAPPPEPQPSFSDVPVDHPFFTEIEWLAQSGVTTGYPDGTFRPTAQVTRQATAAFFHRYSGAPAFDPPTTASFTDVPTTHPFFTEIEWLAQSGVTTGYPDGTFRPTAQVTRQATAAFFYRYDATS